MFNMEALWWQPWYVALSSVVIKEASACSTWSCSRTEYIDPGGRRKHRRGCVGVIKEEEAQSRRRDYRDTIVDQAKEVQACSTWRRCGGSRGGMLQ